MSIGTTYMIQLIIAIVSGVMLGVLVQSHYNDLKQRRSRRMDMPEEDLGEIGCAEPEEPTSKKSRPDPLDYGEINRTYRIADTHFSRGDLEEAEKWFIKVISLHEHHPEALNRLGVIYLQQGNPRRAEILYQKLLAIHQKEAAYYSNYGRCLYNQHKLDEAIKAYENAITLDPSRPARFVSVGQIYYELGNHAVALDYFTKALELDGNNLEYLLITAELAEIILDRDRLVKSLKKIIELDPYNKAAREKFASLLK